MRLCPLESGRYVVISPLFAMDAAMTDAALGFTRPGRALGHGHRCAANLYRDVARRGFLPLPQLPLDAHAFLDLLREAEESLPPVGQLALRWILMFDAVTCAIPGAKRPSQVEDNARAADLPPLTDAQMAKAREIYDTNIRKLVHQRW